MNTEEALALVRDGVILLDSVIDTWIANEKIVILTDDCRIIFNLESVE